MKGKILSFVVAVCLVAGFAIQVEAGSVDPYRIYTKAGSIMNANYKKVWDVGHYLKPGATPMIDMSAELESYAYSAAYRSAVITTSQQFHIQASGAVPNTGPITMKMKYRSSAGSTGGSWSITHGGNAMASGNGSVSGETTITLSWNPYSRWTFYLNGALSLYNTPGADHDSEWLVVDPVFEITPAWYQANPGYSNLEILVQRVKNTTTDWVSQDSSVNDWLFNELKKTHLPAPVPLPPAFVMGAALLGLFGLLRRIRRR